jgi:hypothetical protein
VVIPSPMVVVEIVKILYVFENSNCWAFMY